jgi:hypothetical protein
MTPIDFLLSALSSLVASTIVEAAKHGGVQLDEHRRQELERLRGAVQHGKSPEEHLEAGLAQAFRVLSPIQTYNRFQHLFSDLRFRHAMLRWMLAVSETDRKTATDELKSLSASKLGPEWGEKAVEVLTRAFENVVQSDSLLSHLLSRADHRRLLEAAKETAHTVDLRFQDASRQLSEVMAELAKLRAVASSGVPEPTVTELHEEFGRYTDNVLCDLQIELPLIGSVERIEHSQALRFALDEQAILLLGEAGTGKTGVMARIARSLRQAGECVLYVSADGIARQFSGSCTVVDLSRALGFERPLPQTIGAAADTYGRAWLLLDQLDTVAGEPVGGAFVQLVKRMRGRAGCVVVAACRSYEAEFAADFSTLKLPTLHVTELPPEEVCRCLHILGLPDESNLVSLCGNLLNLSLLANLIRDGASLSAMTVEAQLWRALRAHIAESGTLSLLNLACDCAVAAARAPGGAFHTDSVAQADRLGSFGVLTRLTTGRYRFRHEKLRDYFVAYDSVVRRGEALQALLSRVPAVRTKTIIPWMTQIADCEAPHYLDRLFKEAFDRDLVPSAFPRQALIHSLPLVLNPTTSFVLAIWRSAVEQDNVRWRHDSLCAKVPETQEWAKALWDAGVFELASRIAPGARGYEAAQNVLDLLPLLPKAYSEQVFTWIGNLQTPPPSLTGVCAVLLKAPTSHFRHGMNRVLSWWEQSNDEISLGELDKVQRSDCIVVKNLFDLVERLENDGENQMAVRLVRVATCPFSRQWDFSSPEERVLSPRFRDTFSPPDDARDGSSFAAKFRIGPYDLVAILREHIQRIKEMPGPHSLAAYRMPYACWARVRQLLAPGRKDMGQEWQNWYGALLAAATAALKTDHRRGRECVKNLMTSPDLLEVRVGLHLLAELPRVSSGLLAVARERGHFRQPAAIGESLLVFDRFRARRNAPVARGLAADIRFAIQALDPDLPDHLSLDPPLPDRLLRWADTVALGPKEADDNEDFAILAQFVVVLGYCYRIRSWSFDKLARFCTVCACSDIRSTCQTFVRDGTQTQLRDLTPQWDSLDGAADHAVLYALHARFASLLAKAMEQGTQWTTQPIGYAMLRAAQHWFSDYIERLDQNKSTEVPWALKPKRRPSRKVLRAKVLDLLCAFESAPMQKTQISPAIRAQLAGLLGLFVWRLPEDLFAEAMPALRLALRKLVACSEPGCVSISSWGQMFRDCAQPMATGTVAVFQLIALAWREQYGLATPADIMLRTSEFQPQRGPGRVSRLQREDRRSIAVAIERAASDNREIAHVLGLSLPKLLILDPSLASELIVAVTKGERATVCEFAEGISRNYWAWLWYRELRPLYEWVIRNEDIPIPDGFVGHVAGAYLVGWEELQDDASLIRRLRERSTDQERVGLVVRLCGMYDSLGREQSGWVQVRALWQLASDEAGSHTTRELGAFWRCLQQDCSDTGEDEEKLKLHVPEPIETLAPLLERTCVSLACEPTYRSDGRVAVARYLGSQCVGHETETVRLLGLCLDAERGGYASSILEYHEEARSVLRNAISVGGKARELATHIIERHESESDKSLAGLLL